ncbi:MAG: DUF3782 domain-containing protein [Candidatus Helarchaeales archaeon]
MKLEQLKMSNPLNEKEIRKLIRIEVEKRFQEYQSSASITRDEFLNAIQAMDKRFDELIDSMNKRFEAVDKRFEESDQRLKELIDSMNKRFEESDQRLKELIDSMNKRFEESDKRFNELVENMNKRFEESDQRLKELIDTMNKRFEESDKRFNELVEKMNVGFMKLEAAIGSLGYRSGIRLERTILKLLQKTLEHRNIDINKIERIELFDKNGEVFTKNYRTDIDVLIKNGFHFLMEVKYKADNRDVFHFLKVAELYARNFRRPNKLILLTLDIDPLTQEYAENENIEVITGDFD